MSWQEGTPERVPARKGEARLLECLPKGSVIAELDGYGDQDADPEAVELLRVLVVYWTVHHGPISASMGE